MTGMHPAETFFFKVDFAVKHGYEQVEFFDVLDQAFVDIGYNRNAVARTQDALSKRCPHDVISNAAEMPCPITSATTIPIFS